jgi:alpha-tubulin suppressor-like RCC1 family protein/pimeloyl-ACP methyl ester carboxylesterase
MDVAKRVRTWWSRRLDGAAGSETGRRRVVVRGAGLVALAAVSTVGLVLGLESAAKAAPQVTSTQTTPAQSGKAQPNLSDPTGPYNVPICGDQDGSEQPLVLQCSAYTRVPDLQMLVVPGSGPQTLTFDYVYKAGLIAGEMDFFKVDDAQGSIGTLRPGDPGYLNAVYQRAGVLFPQGANASTPDQTFTLNGGDRYVFMYVTSNLGDLKTYNPSDSASGTPYALFSLDTLNPDGIDHVLAFTDNNGTTQFAFEDQMNGGDRDYDDVVFNVHGPTAARLPLIVLPGITGSYLRSPFGEVWPRASFMAVDPTDTYLDDLQLASDGLSPKDPNDPNFDISVWSDHGTQGVIDELDLGCVTFLGCPIRINFYAHLFDYLESHGYQENVNLFPFAFDWRKSAGFNSSILLAKIDQVLAQTGAPKVNILAHSQGGLVTEVALKDPSSAGKVSRVMTMGTPYLGAAKSLDELDYGEPCQTEMLTICILDPKEVQKLATNFPGVLDLLPSRAYYGQAYPGPVLTLFDRDQNGSIDGFIDFNTERSKLADRNLALIDNSTAFHDHADVWAPADPSVQLVRVVGEDIGTIRTIVEYQQEECGSFWWRGCHVVEKSEPILDNGDGTVPIHSADLYDATRGFDYTGGAQNVYAPDVKHADLPNDDGVLAYAVDYFTGTHASVQKMLHSRASARTRSVATAATGIVSAPSALSGTEIVVRGPVYGLVTDAAGKRVGTPDNSGLELNEIPAGVFNRTDGGGSYFVGLDGTYQGSWTATADGQVQLIDRDYASNTISAAASAPPITVHSGTVLSLGFSRPANLGSLVVNVDDDGNGTVDRTVPFGTPVSGTASADTTPPVSQVTVQNFTDSGGNAMANVTITATDNAGGSGVGRIEYALDSSNTSGVYTSTLTVPATGAIIVRAIDRAGNIEVPYQTIPLSAPVAFAGGSAHSLALLKDGTVWAWGGGYDGEMGNGTTTSSSIPVKVSNLSGVTAIAAGGGHNLALKSDGTVWAWGDGSDGELGNGTTNDVSLPVQVSNLTGVTAIAAGDGHCLARKSDGTVWAWGYGFFGQLGNGSTASSSVPVKVSNLSGVTTIAAGFSHSLARKSDGTVWAWGSNSYGELGNNSTTSSSVPVQVKNLTGATAVAARGYLAHSMALKSDGTVWAWGFNGDGELGNGTTTNSSKPVQVKNLTGATAIAAGSRHSVALKSDGTVWDWGLGGSGQLGNGSTANSPLPVQVSNLTGVTAISAGDLHNLTLKAGSFGWAWGYNSSGQLGTGTTTSSSVPVQIVR